jgi:L-rhamnose mutarotase
MTMSSNNYETPDLASVLSILAGLAPHNQQNQAQAPPQSHTPPFPPQTVPSNTQQPWEVGNQARASTTTNAQVNVVDPATIIEWSAGLRCVMRTVAKHDSILEDVRRVSLFAIDLTGVEAHTCQMIKVQHEHEQQWWKGREALIEKQKSRKEGQKKLDDVL